MCHSWRSQRIDDSKVFYRLVDSFLIVFSLFNYSQVIITDPTAEEENLSSSIVNIAASKGDICFVRKPGGTPLSEEQMEKLFKQALDRETELLKILNDCFSQETHTINQMA